MLNKYYSNVKAEIYNSRNDRILPVCNNSKPQFIFMHSSIQVDVFNQIKIIKSQYLKLCVPKTCCFC